MDETRAKKIIDYTFRDVFGKENPFTMGEFRKRFAYDIDLPKKAKDVMTGSDAWIVSKKRDRIISSATAFEKSKNNSWMLPSGRIESMSDIRKFWERIYYNIADRTLGSKDVSESDLTYDSSNIYGSYRTFQSQDIVFSHSTAHSRYVVASYDNAGCTSGIRMFYGTFCSSSFAVDWSKKVSKCMFVSGCVDLHECLFCSNIESKSYCVANMQFTKDKYLKIKDMVVEWVLENFGTDGGKDILSM
ncbi:Uncharacterised protein [uncultured archaeon]|nr:Uncharacterised protein [uncultured archaeon]